MKDVKAVEWMIACRSLSLKIHYLTCYHNIFKII